MKMKFFNESDIAVLYIPIAISLILGSIITFCYSYFILSLIIGIFAILSPAIYDFLYYCFS